MADASEKPCKKCGELKPLDSFHEYPANRGRKAYRDGSCRRCRQDKINEANRAKRARQGKDNPEARAARKRWEARGQDARKMDHVQRHYGLSREAFIELALKQDFRCPVCTDPVEMSKWHVDHDHACCPGKKSCGNCVRGLLDFKCNSALGKFKDNVATLSRAQAYLEVNGAT